MQNPTCASLLPISCPPPPASSSPHQKALSLLSGQRCREIRNNVHVCKLFIVMLFLVWFIVCPPRQKEPSFIFLCLCANSSIVCRLWIPLAKRASVLRACSRQRRMLFATFWKPLANLGWTRGWGSFQATTAAFIGHRPHPLPAPSALQLNLTQLRRRKGLNFCLPPLPCPETFLS